MLPLVTKIAQFITKAINGFRDLSTETKTTVLTLTAIVAAGGPIISAIGFISTALSALLTPTGLIIAGIAAAGYAVYKFWDVIRPVLVKTINFFIDLYNESTLFRGVIIGLKYTISQTFNFFGKAIRAVIDEAKNLGEILMAAFTLDWDRFTAAVTNIGTGFVDNMKAYFAEASEAGAEALEEIFTPRGKIELVTEAGLQKGIDNMVAPLKKMWNRVTGMFTFKGGPGTSTGGDILPTLDPSALEDFMYGDDDAKTTQSNLKKSSLAWQQYGVAVKASAEQAAGAITGMVDNVLAEGIMRLGEGLQTGEKTFEDFGTFLLSTFASTAEQLGKLAISVGFAVEGIKKALQSLNPAVAVAAGVALLALAGAARGRMKQIAAGKDQVKLAKGGLAYGETLAVVGDNPNARMDPEVIAPLSKLQSMIGNAGGGRVEVYGRLSGQDILLSTEKANRTRSRYRGF